MRLALITHNYPFKEGEGKAAAGLFVSAFAHALRDAGTDAFVFTGQLGGLSGESGFDVKWFPWKGDKPLGHLNFFNPKELKLLIQYLRNGRESLFGYVKEKNIEHCLAFWAFPAGYFAWVIKNKLGIPYTVWALGSDIWTYSRWPIARGLIKKILTSADCLYADGIKLCEDIQTLCGRECKFLPSTRDLLAPVFSPLFNPSPQGNATPTAWCCMGGSEEVIKFLYIGRFEKIKGIDFLLDAVYRLKQRTKDFRLFAFGGGRLYEEMKLKLANLSLEGEVTLGGYIEDKDAAAFLYDCDCLIIPSRQESIPIIYSDGLKAGINIVTSDAGDLGRLFRDYGYGRIFSSGDVNALTDALFSFIKERQSGRKDDMPPEKLLNLFDQKRIVREFLKNLER